MELSEEIRNMSCYKTGFKRPRKKPSYKCLYYKPFGRFMINMKYLDENKILIKYPQSHAPVKNYPQTKKSFELCDVIRNMIKNKGQINKELFNKLKTDDVKYLEDLLKISKLDLELNYQEEMYESVYDYKERFNLLMNNIQNGDINTEIINELTNLIEVLSTNKVNKISNEDKEILLEVLNTMKEETNEEINE